MAPGETTTLTGTGFPAGQPAVVDLFSDPVRLASVTVNRLGTFVVVVMIPQGTPVGIHTLVATGPGGGFRAELPLNVGGSPGLLGPMSRIFTPLLGPVPATGPGTVTLARTGSYAAKAARLAALLVVLGAAMLTLAWKSSAVGNPAGWGRRVRR